MEYFLQKIARSVYSGYGEDLRNHCLVFPSRRSGLFFSKYLSQEIYRPIWMPAIMTINDMFHSFSSLVPAENEVLLFELYKVYRNISKSGESFDDFYFWGDMLLNDFDDADKYLADTSRLFSNVGDLKKIDQQFGGLTPQQVEVIKRFWTNFDPVRITGTKEKFLSVWSELGSLYTEFNKVLRAKNIAYEGMIFREVAEKQDLVASPGIRWKTVHFVGFNALNECEKVFMMKLKESGNAKFYWDFDNSYINEGGLNSAGLFLKSNLKLFGNDMPDDWDYNTLLSVKRGEAEIRIVETSSDIAQVKLIPKLLEEIPRMDMNDTHDTAVVLADENLLLPLITSLPPEIGDINITMGYPLKHTSAYSLVKHLLELQRNSRSANNQIFFSHQEVTRIINNELIGSLLNDEDKKIPEQIIRNNLIMVPASHFNSSPLLSQVFRKMVSPAEISAYIKDVLGLIITRLPESTKHGSMPVSVVNEFIYRIMLAINRLDTILLSPEITLKTETWARLLDRILRTQSVPFSGEPLSGIQIMGILETRTLDFKNIIMLSVNEGIMPAVTASSSFIPFSLRQAFGLPSVNHQESVYAYHFYRLLHKAKNITFVFNSNPEGFRSGEMSRFLQQLKYDPSADSDFLNLGYEIRNPVAIGDTIEKTKEHIGKLYSRFPGRNGSRPLSPSAINTWLNCSMKFYYQYVNGLSEPRKVIREIDPARLGSMVHLAIRSLYEGYIGKSLDADTITGIIKNREALSRIIIKSVNSVLKRDDESYTAINEMMAREVLENYVLRILETDRASAPFTILAIEKPFTCRFSFSSGEGLNELLIGGNIDRVDIRDGIIRIIDYKTGITSESVDGLSDLFQPDRDKDHDAWLQTLIYCEAYLSGSSGATVRPAVYRLKLKPGEKVSDKLILENNALEDYSVIRKDFLTHLEVLIRSIFGEEGHFKMTEKQNKKCNFCPFKVLCGR